MKYVILLCDGMADYPVEELGGKTPMDQAHNPCMNWLAQTGELGLVRTVPEGMTPGSDVANLSVMGYDPTRCYTGRSPLEAANMGIDLSDSDLAMRCNLVTLSEEENFNDKKMVDYCAGDISSEEAAELIAAVQKAFGNDSFSFYPGVSYRHCLVWHGGILPEEIGVLTPPHDISGKVIGPHLNRNPKAAPLMAMMEQSGALLQNHPVNLARIAAGKRPATHLWFWGQGKRPALEPFSAKTGLKGSVVSAVDLVRGIGRCAKMNTPAVPGATGYIDTNFEGKAAAALNELQNGQDFVYIHVEAPDECGHRGEVQNKVRSIELIDQRLLKPLLEGLERWDDFRLMILPDHPTPLSTMTHASDPVPFLIYQKSEPKLGAPRFTEHFGAGTGLFIDPGYTLINRFLQND